MVIEKEKENLIKDIRLGYKKIKGKTNFIIEVALALDKAEGTIRNWWFGGFWKIPLEYHERVLELINNKIKTQNHEKSI